MRHIYGFVDKKIKNSEKKYGWFLALNMAVFALAGLILWLIAGRLIMAGFLGIFCFMGYPMFFIGFLGGILFIYNQGDSKKNASNFLNKQEENKIPSLKAGFTY